MTLTTSRLVPARRLVYLLALAVALTSTAGRAESGCSGSLAAVSCQPERTCFSSLPWESVEMLNGNLGRRFTDLLPGEADESGSHYVTACQLTVPGLNGRRLDARS
jgi:hypothetical protein